MKWNVRKDATSRKPVSKLQEWRSALVFAVVAATLIRWSTVEAFVVPTSSMENTVLVGDYLFVSKFHYGARTPRTPLQIPLTHQTIWGTSIPSYLDWIELPSYRLPGIRKLKREDVVVFNLPVNDIKDTKNQSRPIDLKTYYVKRCVGVAGDTLQIMNRQVYANSKLLRNHPYVKHSYFVTAQDEIRERNLRNLELDSEDYFLLSRTNGGRAVYRMLLTNEQVNRVKSLPYIDSVVEDRHDVDSRENGIYPHAKAILWNEDHYGPIVVPSKGMTIMISDSTLVRYGDVIKYYEHLQNVEVHNDRLLIDGRAVDEYTFKQDYYFMMGDNRNNSWDSRFWGFVPEDHIVGKPLFIWLSLDNEADVFHKLRWKRMFTWIE